MAPSPSPADCGSKGAPFSPAALMRDIDFLAAPALDGRETGSKGDLAARQYLIARFQCLGLTPAADGRERGMPARYEQYFSYPLVVASANILGMVPGTDPAVAGEIILLAAHHDHLGKGHLGANDNASGTAALLAIAEAVVTAGGARRTIAFAAFGGEEQGLVGSRHFFMAPPKALPPERIVQVINLDMIGSYSSKKRVHAFGAFPGLPATALLAQIDDAYPKTRVALGGHSVRGDHHGFCAIGIPYVFFWTPDARCYHRRCDTPARIDRARLSDIAAMAGALTLGLGDTEADLAASRARRDCGRR